MEPQRRRLITDGLVTGLVGYGLVAAFFAARDLMVGRSPLYTVTLIGEAVFSGVADLSGVTPAPGPILAVNSAHMVAFVAFGFFAAWLTREAERHPEFWHLALLSFLGATVISYAGVLAALALVGSPLAAGSVVAASVVGAAGMGTYLVVSHRSMIDAIHHAKETQPGGVE